jgi:hypothetical protein
MKKLTKCVLTKRPFSRKCMLISNLANIDLFEQVEIRSIYSGKKGDKELILFNFFYNLFDKVTCIIVI